MGGEGLQRQNSLKSGLHVWLMLQNHPELQVFATDLLTTSVLLIFMVVPAWAAQLLL